MSHASVAGCFICDKHLGAVAVPGGAVYEDELVYAGHASIPNGEETAYLGALLVEPKRHAAGVADLDQAEAERLGLIVSRLGRALTESEGAEHVYVFVLGHQVSHLHVWVVPRYPGTPRAYWGMHVDEWPQAPRGGAEEIATLCERLRTSLGN